MSAQSHQSSLLCSLPSFSLNYLRAACATLFIPNFFIKHLPGQWVVSYKTTVQYAQVRKVKGNSVSSSVSPNSSDVNVPSRLWNALVSFFSLQFHCPLMNEALHLVSPLSRLIWNSLCSLGYPLLMRFSFQCWVSRGEPPCLVRGCRVSLAPFISQILLSHLHLIHNLDRLAQIRCKILYFLYLFFQLDILPGTTCKGCMWTLPIWSHQNPRRQAVGDAVCWLSSDWEISPLSRGPFPCNFKQPSVKPVWIPHSYRASADPSRPWLYWQWHGNLFFCGPLLT